MQHHIVCGHGIAVSRGIDEWGPHLLPQLHIPSWRRPSRWTCSGGTGCLWWRGPWPWRRRWLTRLSGQGHDDYSIIIDWRGRVKGRCSVVVHSSTTTTQRYDFPLTLLDESKYCHTERGAGWIGIKPWMTKSIERCGVWKAAFTAKCLGTESRNVPLTYV